MSGTPRSTATGVRRSPIERFLGSDEAAGGPFALLGISPSACDDESILGALDRRLERVNAHVECDTPEADEVRLALHAGAAQLLDPAVRRHLVARWSRRPISSDPPPSAPSAESGRRAPEERLLEHDAILTLGLFGGWNRRSLQRLVALAHARGLGSDRVAAVLRGLAVRRRARSAGPANGAQPTTPNPRPRPRGLASVAVRRDVSEVRTPDDREPFPEQIDPARALIRNALIFGGVGILVFALLIALLVRVLTAPAKPGPPAPVGASSPAPLSTRTTPLVSPTDVANADPLPARRERPAVPSAPIGGELDAALRDLAACAEAVAVDPIEAAERFEKAVAGLAADWPRAAPDRLIAAHDAIVEFLYRAGDDPSISKRAVAAIGAGAGALSAPVERSPAADAARVWPSVWSVGMLVRLTRERDLSAAVRDDVERRVVEAAGHARPVVERGFESGAGAALALLPRVMLGAAGVSVTPEPWALWADAADAVGPDRPARDRIILGGLEAVLLHAAEPNADRGVLDVVNSLVIRLAWRPGDESRRWLLRWFDDRRVTPADLNAVTSALATRSGAEGVDLTMVLSAAAAQGVRADLRDRFAAAWSITLDVDRGALADEWSSAADAFLERSALAASATEDLACAAILARLNAAAWRLWRADHDAAKAILNDPAGDADAAAAVPSPTAPGDFGDGAWGERYLAARKNVPIRLEMLGRLAARGAGLGPVDAEVLAAEAFTGSPNEVRARAAELLRYHADNPSVVNATLETLPRAPRVLYAGELVAQVAQRRLPMVRDPSWPAAARRALVDRLLELQAAEGEHGATDRLSRVLASAYRELGAETPLTDTERNTATQPAAHGSAAAVRTRWREAAGRLPPMPRSAATPGLDVLDRRHAGRAGVARGLIQMFAAEQLGAAEVMAHVIAAEHPARADRVEAILAELAERRRAARHIFAQINAAERAMIQLWVVRRPEPAA
ncbi:MAG: hypothetical protein ACKVU4_11330 [Phycisphaerales bacterium]